MFLVNMSTIWICCQPWSSSSLFPPLPSLPCYHSVLSLRLGALFLRDNRPNLLFIRLKSHSAIEQLTASRSLSQSELPQVQLYPLLRLLSLTWQPLVIPLLFLFWASWAAVRADIFSTFRKNFRNFLIDLLRGKLLTLFFFVFVFALAKLSATSRGICS